MQCAAKIGVVRTEVVVNERAVGLITDPEAATIGRGLVVDERARCRMHGALLKSHAAAVIGLIGFECAFVECDRRVVAGQATAHRGCTVVTEEASFKQRLTGFHAGAAAVGGSTWPSTAAGSRVLELAVEEDRRTAVGVHAATLTTGFVVQESAMLEDGVRRVEPGAATIVSGMVVLDQAADEAR